LPNIFKMSGYTIFFWSNENGEPIHVHVCKGTPTATATKIWLTSAGGCVVANNKSRIPQKELNQLLEAISAHYFMICRKWKEYFFVDEVKFYC